MSFLLGGVRVDAVSTEALHEHIVIAVKRRRQTIICNANANAIVLAQSNDEFRQTINAASLVFCDGYGVLLASKLLGGDARERITYADWIHLLCDLCVRHGMSMFLLGSAQGVAGAAASELKRRHPGLIIAGTHHGYFELNGPDNDQVAALLNAADPDILLVGFGMPAQELWIRRNHARLNARVILPCGACLDYVSGRTRRGPHWMTNHGMEWLARLLLEPRRLWRRYTLGNLQFARVVLTQRFKPSKS